jgi:aspartyl-tRNA(Asn)/glutamyl-tRNA(Gln) amidotransferase subunit A
MMDWTLKSARDALRSKAISSVELTQAHLDAIEALNPTLNAYITVTGDQAMDQAREGCPHHRRQPYPLALHPAL